MLRRPTDSDRDGTIVLDTADPGAWKDKYPSLWLFLTAVTYPEGDRRQTGTVLIFLDAGRLKACLSDRECGEVAFVSHATPDGLLEAVEAGLAGGGLDWRAAHKKGGGRR